MMFFYSIIKKILKAVYPLMPGAYLRVLILRLCSYKIGKQVYIPASFKISDLKSRRKNLSIGDRVSIGPGVTVITDSSPNKSRLLKLFPLVSEDVIIEKDAWLGANVTVLPGVIIGECSIIASGSVVNKDVPAFSIAAGVPAKVIKKIPENEL